VVSLKVWYGSAMKKLTTLVMAVALAATVAGCKKKRDTEARDETPTKQAEPEPPKEAPKPEPPKEAPTEPPKAEAAAAPAECTDYKALVDKLASCDKLPAAQRDSLKAAFDTAAKDWGTPPADDAAKKALADRCKAGAESVKTAAAKTCGW
jgi:hypothetical protein